MDRVLLVLLVAGVAAYPAYARARKRAAASREARAGTLLRAGLAVAVGALIGLRLPHRVPETSGSPASLVAVLLLWLVGGVLAILGLAALIGALLARPGDDGA